MPSPNEKLVVEIEAFRRDQALAYLQRLAGTPPEEVRGQRSRALLVHDVGLELVQDALRGGEISPHEHAAVCAHIARAAAESRYEQARIVSANLASSPIRVGSETHQLADALREWSQATNPATRTRLEAAADGPFGEHAQYLMRTRALADDAAAKVLAKLAPARHPDAGPEGGVAQVAEQWLRDSADLASEAFHAARASARCERESGLDTLWACLGTPMCGLFRTEGRFRRLSEELAPLGLRTQLARSARLAPGHPGPFPAPQVLVINAPHRIRVSPSAIEIGLVNELLAAEALGRAAAHTHASPSLPYTLRHASAGTVARSIGGLSQLRFSEPSFLRKRRGLSIREAGDIARISTAFILLDSRLAAASLLGRGLRGTDAEGRAQALCERALMGHVPPGIAQFLLTRLSASSAFRGKVWAPALAHSLRERFDSDWHENPRAGEPLRGAMARAGDFSVEGFAEELGANIAGGLGKLSELF